jgi:hypothetical protein
MLKTSNLTISIVQEDKVRDFFIKANRIILQKYFDYFKEIRDHSRKVEILKSLWGEEFSCELIFEKSIPFKIVFKNDHAMTLFFLRFNM